MRTCATSLGLLLGTLLSAGTPPEVVPSAGVTGFIANKGQIIDQDGRPNAAVLYLFSGDGLNVQLRRTGFSYDAWREEENTPPDADGPRPMRLFHRVDIDLLGASPQCRVVATDPGRDLLHYCTGVPVEGASAVRHFATVTYHEVYPHIDAAFRVVVQDGRPRVKYDIVVRPGGDLAQVRMRYAGAPVELDATGVLTLATRVGRLQERVPESWIERNGRRTAVSVRTIDLGENVFGFRGEGSTHAPMTDGTLVIDPVPSIAWATLYGGIGNDVFLGAAIAADGAGYACGDTRSINWIATSGAEFPVYQIAWGTTGMLVKSDANGVRLWATYYGERGTSITDVAISATNRVYIAGHTSSSNGIAFAFAPGVTHQSALGGGTDGFLARFGENGMRAWGSYYGGPSTDKIQAIACDGAGDVIVAGSTCSTTGIATPGAVEPAYSGVGCALSLSENGLLAKFSANGPRLWGTYVGTGSYTEVQGVSTDGTDVLIAGVTGATTIGTPGAHQPSIGAGRDGFLARYAGAGAKLWGTYYGGGYSDEATDCLVEPGTGMVYLCGTTASPDGIATPGAHQSYNLSPIFSRDAFLAKFNGSGTRQWGTYLGGNELDEGHALAIGITGRIYLSGLTFSSSGIATSGTPGPARTSIPAAFLVRFGADGQRAWGTYSNAPWTGDVRCTARGTAILLAAGVRGEAPTTAGAHQTEFGGPEGPGGSDGYLVCYRDPNIFHPWPPLGIDGAPSITARSLDDGTIEVKALSDAASAESGSVVVSDAQGRLVQEKRWPDLREPLVLDLPGRARGILLVRVVTGTRSFGTKVLSPP